MVEEIAIASGMPVPAVFVLDDESSMNAFAAGSTAENAAIGVTRGALTHLDRSELQGVIGHEMSHLRNADTRIKTRIIGWVFGIAAVAVLGRVLLFGSAMAPRRRGREGDAGLLLVLAGLGLVVVGAVGVLFARLVQGAHTPSSASAPQRRASSKPRRTGPSPSGGGPLHTRATALTEEP